MSTIVEQAKELSKEGELDDISDSESVYYEFRQTVEGGMFDAGFDLLPSKSSAHRSNITGEVFVDQPLRNHLLNGAAFGSRFNHALRELDQEVALSSEELKIALALFAVHDAHKTRTAQQRREEAYERSDRRDADKDISDEELLQLIETLNLDSYVGVEKGGHSADTTIDFNSYLASALAAEQNSGRHRSVFSRRFAATYRGWVRLMDAAASLSSPADVTDLSDRIETISNSVELHYHQFGDQKGIATNLLNKTVADRARANGAEPVVFYNDGAIYVAPADTPGGVELVFDNLDEISTEFYDDYIATVVESNPGLGREDGLRKSLNDTNWPRGYLSIPETGFLFAQSAARTSSEYDSALPILFEVIQSEIKQRAEREPDRYSVYEKALKHGVATGEFDDLPKSYLKPQLAGAYLGTIFNTLLYHDTGVVGRGSEQYRQAVVDLAEAIGVPAAAESYFEPQDESPSDFSIMALADSLKEEPDRLREELSEGISLDKQLRIESFYLGLAFLYRNDSLDSRSLPTILDDLNERILTAFESWPTHWDNVFTEWDGDWGSKRKHRELVARRTGNLSEGLPEYVKRYLTIDGKGVSVERRGGKFDEYLSPAYGSKQPRICLLCNDELSSGTARFCDFETNENEVGRSLTFTHLSGLDPESGEINSVICPMCQFELNLRNAVHPTDEEGDSLYLFFIPDYFHSPLDLSLARYVRQLMQTSAGALLDVAQEVITSDVESRSESVQLFLEVLQSDDAEAFQQSVQNYDGSYTDANMLGVYRFDCPSRPSERGGGEVSRTTHWALTIYAGHILSWVTGTRVLISDSPFPTTDFTEFNQMITAEGVPSPVKRTLSKTTTISSRRDLGQSPAALTLRQPRSEDRVMGGREETTDNTDDFSGDGDYSRGPETDQMTSKEVLSGTRDQPTDNHDEANPQADGEQAEESGTSGVGATQSSVILTSEFGVTLYRQSALWYLTKRLHGYDSQRVTTLLGSMEQPFAGAGSILRGDEALEDYGAQFGALALDTTSHPSMTETMERLADNGFELLSPGRDASNHDYERLFRDAAETLSDGFAENDREVLIQTIAGTLANTGRRINQKQPGDYEPDEGDLLNPAKSFAEIFVDEIFYEMCDGDYYRLRRLQDRLASGFNLAMREQEREFLNSLNEGDDMDTEESA